MNNKKIAYWSIGWGNYSKMMQTLINSFHKFNIEGDFIAFSDETLDNCINEPLDSNIPLDLSNYLFKFHYLKKLNKYDYDYFVFIDCDSVFVAEPKISPLFFVQNNNPWHCFLESPINANTTRRGDWWGVPVQQLTNYFRELGVICNEIRNMNAGYWVCQKEFIDHAFNLGMESFQFFKDKGFNITEEIPMAYISNYICADVSFHFHEKYIDYWASDWTGVFKDKYPDYIEWDYESYMTGEQFKVKPALVHAMRSKQALINHSMRNIKFIN
jgi:hypothetical protein